MVHAWVEKDILSIKLKILIKQNKCFLTLLDTSDESERWQRGQQTDNHSELHENTATTKGINMYYSVWGNTMCTA